MLEKVLFTFLFLVTLVLTIAAVPVLIYAQTPNSPTPNIQYNVCSGATNLIIGGKCSPKSISDQQTIDKINKLLKDFITLLSSALGILAVIMVMVGGFKYIISGGSDKNISSAKNTILYAIIGIVIAASAQYIVKFVLAKVTTG